jgi:hypothetical protein
MLIQMTPDAFEHALLVGREAGIVHTYICTLFVVLVQVSVARPQSGFARMRLRCADRPPMMLLAVDSIPYVA